MTGRRKKIGFFVFRDIQIPLHLREYYAGVELRKAGWEVEWLLPESGKESPDLQVDWPIVRYSDCDFRGHKYVFPIYLAWFLKRRGVDVLWISGWALRYPSEFSWIARTVKLAGLKLVYDTVDPIDMFNETEGTDRASIERTKSYMRQVYDACDLVLTVTPEIQKWMESRGVAAEKVVSCRWGTDVSVFRPGNDAGDFRQEIGVGADTFLVGWLGSMNPFKGLREIIIPVIEGCGCSDAKVHFVIAGNGILEGELRAWAGANPDLPVTILGNIPYRKAPAFTGSLDVYLVPTNPDTVFARSICPVKCFDALAMGVDLLTTRTEATAFLEQVSSLAHLCDFSVKSFERELEALIAASSKGARRQDRVGFTTISHQAVSREICAFIDGRLGGA